PRAAAIRFMERLQRPAEVEDLDLRQDEKNHLFDGAATSDSSLTMSPTPAMRAKRLRSTNSVRLKMSSVAKISPVFGSTMGNVCVASVTKSASYPRSAARRVVVSQHCSHWRPVMTRRVTPRLSSRF